MFKSITLVLTLFIFFTVPVCAYEPAGTPPDWDSPLGKPKPYKMFLGDRLEARFDDDIDTYLWDIQGWYGGDRNRIWFKSEGEGEQGESPEEVELQLLFSRLIAPFWDWQIGVRHDFKPNPERTYAVLGVQGVIPYEFESDNALFINEDGDVSTRIEAEYNINITQRLVLQPRLELNAALSNDRTIGIGSGVNDTEIDLRLRYHITRELAPYIGVSWEQLYGNTKDFAQDEGEPTSLTSIVIGLRIWY